MRKVTIGQYFQTIRDVNDGFGGKTGSCREQVNVTSWSPRFWTCWVEFVDTPGWVQFVKSGSYVVLINTELRYRYRLRRENGSYSWIVISRGPNRYVDESSHDQDDPPQGIEMVSSTSVEQSHAVTLSITETHAPKPQEQPSLVNYPSAEFIQLDKRKWNVIMMSTRILRETDGAVHWGSLFPKLRRDFEREGARTFSATRWLGHTHRGSNKSRFQ